MSVIIRVKLISGDYSSRSSIVLQALLLLEGLPGFCLPLLLLLVTHYYFYFRNGPDFCVVLKRTYNYYVIYFIDLHLRAFVYFMYFEMCSAR